MHLNCAKYTRQLQATGVQWAVTTPKGLYTCVTVSIYERSSALKKIVTCFFVVLMFHALDLLHNEKCNMYIYCKFFGKN